MNLYAKSAAFAVVLANDFWYMHLYAKDADFDKSHSLSHNYYSMLYTDADILMELAIQEGYDVVNPNEVLSVFPDFTPEHQTAYSYFELVKLAEVNLRRYIECLRDLRATVTKTDVQSKLDGIIEYWNKEVNYRLARRSDTPVILNGFVNSGLDNALAYRIGGMGR